MHSIFGARYYGSRDALQLHGVFGLPTGVRTHEIRLHVPVHSDANFFFHQLLSGVDVAIPSHASTPSQRRVFNLAKQMQNYMYLVGDAQARECVAVDAVYDPAGVVAAAEQLGCNVTAAIATHFHYDHIGHNGQSFGGPGMPLPGKAPNSCYHIA